MSLLINVSSALLLSHLFNFLNVEILQNEDSFVLQQIQSCEIDASVVQQDEKMSLTASTFIQLFYLLNFHLYKFATFSFSPSLESRQVSDNRFTVSTSAETEGDGGGEGGGGLLPQLRQCCQATQCRDGPVGGARGPHWQWLASVRVLHHWRWLLPQFLPAACFSPIGGQRLLKVTFTDHR